MGKLSLVPNIVKKFGWNPADRLLKVLYAFIKEKMGRADVTFIEVGFVGASYSISGQHQYGINTMTIFVKYDKYDTNSFLLQA